MILCNDGPLLKKVSTLRIPVLYPGLNGEVMSSVPAPVPVVFEHPAAASHRVISPWRREGRGLGLYDTSNIHSLTLIESIGLIAGTVLSFGYIGVAAPPHTQT